MRKQQQPKLTQKQQHQLEELNRKMDKHQKKLELEEEMLRQAYLSTSDTATESGEDSSSSEASLTEEEYLCQEVSDTINEIKYDVRTSKLGADESQRSLFINKLQKLPEYKLSLPPKAGSTYETHKSLKKIIRCLNAIHTLINADDELYQYTQDTLEILIPTQTQITLSSDDPTITDFLKPLIASQRNGVKGNNYQEICRLNNELTKVNKLLLKATRDKLVSDKVCKENSDKLKDCENELAKRNKTVDHLKAFNQHIIDEIQERDSELQESHSKIEKLLVDVADLKEIAESSKSCTICFESRSLAACIPCGHVFCTGCIPKFAENLCPICRVKITQSVVLYYS